MNTSAKGKRLEHDVVKMATKYGLTAYRHAGSGAFEGLKHDGTLKDLPILGTVSLECKQRKEGAGRLLESWCDGADLLITRADRAQPMVHMPLEMLFQVLKGVKDAEESNA